MASNKLRTRIVYTPEAVDQMTDRAVRKAYSQLRHIATERMKRLERYGYTNYKAYQSAVTQNASFPTMKNLSNSEVRQLLLDSSHWLRNPMTKAAELRRRNKDLVRNFREMGYNFVNEKNINDFLNFLNEHREAYAEKNFDYHKIAQAYGDMERLQIPREYLEQHFEEFITNQKDLQKVRLSGDKEADSRKISDALGINKRVKKRKR